MRSHIGRPSCTMAIYTINTHVLIFYMIYVLCMSITLPIGAVALARTNKRDNNNPNALFANAVPVVTSVSNAAGLCSEMYI